MEFTKEKGLLDKIRPPRLEDAGLEDCALPPESIKDAFLKAATAVRSIISASDDEDEPEGHCVETPSPMNDPKDALVGITEGAVEGSGKCSAEKGMPEGTNDVVAIEGVNDEEDNGDLVVGGGSLPEGGESCVDGLQGLEIGGKSGKKKKKEVTDSDEENEKKPILVEGYVV